MSASRTCVAALLAMTVLATLGYSRAGAEEGTLELKRLPANNESATIQLYARQPQSPVELITRSTYPQHFYAQIGKKGATAQGSQTKPFDKVVTKEPEKYNLEAPFRAVARLGSGQYGFVLDASDAKKKGYNRLYFDLNGNGDLTDERPIDAKENDADWGGNMSYAQFPRVDLKLADGKNKYDYSFLLTAYSQIQEERGYVSASLNAAAYRVGKITVDGSERHVVLIDFNSNGRFDDTYRVRDDAQGPDGEIYPEQGDAYFLDAEKDPAVIMSLYGALGGKSRHLVAKLTSIDGDYYDMTVSPSGDKVTLAPSSIAMGNLTNPNGKFQALIYGPQGFLTIVGEKDKPAKVPVGEWRLLSYTIDRTDEKKPEPEKKAEEKEEKKRSLLEAVTSAFFGAAVEESTPAVVRRPRRTYVSATATAGYKPVTVEEGKAATMPFGPPYKPVVSAAMMGDDKKKMAYLGLSLVGSAGERCSDIEVEGSRPSRPEFVISTLDGEKVESGRFEYG